MRLMAGLFLILTGTVSAAPPTREPEDSPAAAYTRTQRLKATVTLDVKDVTLQAFLQALSDQLEGQKHGRLGFTFATGADASAKITVAVKNVTVRKLLDDVLTPLGQGYVVVSKEAEKADGWLKLTRGRERGYEAGREPADTDDSRAAEKLTQAKKLLAEGSRTSAGILLKQIVKDYPDTPAAVEAKKLLDNKGKP